MIRKPTVELPREPTTLATLRTAAMGSVALARAGSCYVRGLVCWGFAVLWGFAALTGGLLAGSLPTLFGVGAMASFMAWAGARQFAKTRENDRAVHH